MKQALLLAALLTSTSACNLFEQAEPAPTPIGAIPTEAQVDWHKLETYAFVHFGLNTYNDLEWGYGNTPASTFAPDTLDVEQWVTTLKRAGMKGVILTAKHHDGFCLWPTKTTDYSVKSSPWQGGKGDLVRDLSNACRKHDLKFGLYLSPWDRNNEHYGTDRYREIFHEQIRELTTGYGELFEYWFDGANGGTGWYGGADSARSINPETYYGYHEAGELLRTNNPNIMIFGGTEPTIRWVGNERGWAGETNYATYDRTKEHHHSEAQWGMRDADKWLPAEVDVSIRPGWFYHHREDHQVRSVADLTNLYYQSVGRNATLLLNCPISLEGRIPAQDSANLIAWYEHLQRSFADNLLSDAKVEASNSRKGRAYRPKNLIDGSADTYWATADGVHTAELTFTLGAQRRVNNVLLQEYIRLGQRVEGFELETRNPQGAWERVETLDSLTTIGYKRIIRFSAVETDALRVRITSSRGVICLAEVAAYFAPTLLEAPEISRNDKDELIIKNKDLSTTTRYRTTGDEWQDYGATPPVLSSNHLAVEVLVSDALGENKVLAEAKLGYAPSAISTPGLTDEQRSKLLDGVGFTAITLPKGKHEVTLSLRETGSISKIVYTPDQRRDATGHIQRYEVYVDGKRVSSGELSNIKNNPIPVDIALPEAVIGRVVRLIVTKTVDDTAHLSIGGLDLF